MMRFWCRAASFVEPAFKKHRAIVQAELGSIDPPSIVYAPVNVAYTCSICGRSRYGKPTLFYNPGPSDVVSTRYACLNRRACRRREFWNKYARMVKWLVKVRVCEPLDKTKKED